MQQEMMEVVVVQTGTSRCANTEQNTNRMILLPPTQQSKHGINQLFEYRSKWQFCKEELSIEIRDCITITLLTFTNTYRQHL